MHKIKRAEYIAECIGGETAKNDSLKISGHLNGALMVLR